MRRRTHNTVGLFAALAASLPVQSLQADSTLYTGMTLVDPIAQRHVSNAYVLVEHGRIRAVGTGRVPKTIEADTVRDFSGSYALPGLIDAHAHLTVVR